ncbi:hypothetical protein [Enterococcus sp. AZ109]|uniref:hypothetical protein n=1 Tax=Enterococcus sp. AZ109 TaxID=2774634 RepID=UPI003F20C75B
MNRGLRRYWQVDGREAGYNISWGSIFAGVVTFFALLFTFSLIGSAIGFGMVEPTSNNPLDGVGTGVLIWTVVTMVLSFFGAGLVSGIAARRVGLLHGFLTWATSVFALIAILSYVTIGAFSAVGSLLGNVTSAIGDGVETVASGAGDAITQGFEDVSGNISSVDTQNVQNEVEEVLQDTDIPELQPNYLRDQLSATTDEITEAGKQIVTNPDNSDQIISDLSNRLEERAQTIGDSVDEQAIANAVESNTDLNQQEAEEATQNIVNGLRTASDEAQTQVENARNALNQAQDDLDDAIQEARQTADEAATATSQASIWAFVAMILGLVLTAAAGYLGANMVKDPVIEDKM